ncbi:MAG: M23 family metallopeptidase, partial [Myxococcota bacterium]
GWRGGGGNTIIVKHDNGLQTVYMHLSKFRKGQKVGRRVASKTVIGYVGSTGMSTGPHLHFGVKKNGRYVDPLKLEPSRRRGVTKKLLARFKADVGALARQMAAISIHPTGNRTGGRLGLRTSHAHARNHASDPTASR